MDNSRDFVSEQIAEIRGTVGDGRVLCALSGGVDSSVAAVNRVVYDVSTKPPATVEWE